MPAEVSLDLNADPEVEKKYYHAQDMFLAGDTAGAISLLNELAATGFLEAKLKLGDIYRLHAEYKNTDTAMQYYSDAAELGYSPAYALLGSMYHTGEGVEKSALKAMDYYLEGAKLGDRDSCAFLGELLASGQLGEASHDLALSAYWSAARSGSALAQRRLRLVLL